MTAPAPSGPPVDPRDEPVLDYLLALNKRVNDDHAVAVLAEADAADQAAGVVRVDTTAPSDEQVERVANALFVRTDLSRKTCRSIARSALAALREDQ